MRTPFRPRYLLVFIPAVVGITLSLIFRLMTPTDYPDPAYPFRTKGTLNWLSSAWIYVGVGLSLLALVLVLMEAGFDSFEAWRTRRSINKEDERRARLQRQHNKAL